VAKSCGLRFQGQKLRGIHSAPTSLADADAAIPADPAIPLVRIWQLLMRLAPREPLRELRRLTIRDGVFDVQGGSAETTKQAKSRKYRTAGELLRNRVSGLLESMSYAAASNGTSL